MPTTTSSESFTTDYLAEIMMKLKGDGLKRTELDGRYSGQSVTTGMSVVQYLKLLKIYSQLSEQDGIFFLKPRLD